MTNIYFLHYLIQGYFGQDGQVLDGIGSSPSFFEEGGKRWFRTGDIGEFDKDGKYNNSQFNNYQFNIID